MENYPPGVSDDTIKRHFYGECPRCDEVIESCECESRAAARADWLYDEQKHEW